ncbi:MAG TPA: transglycosylase SLT domain-containing protein [Anaeromyxobacteraceae bacterium]|nr:transglycosylase SLT domain-containing protein [Anaeromyxobacteraceae bacterium]
MKKLALWRVPALFVCIPALSLAAEGGPELPVRPFTEAEVAPFFVSPVLAKASADLAQGRYEPAAEEFARSGAPEARFAMAMALIASGRGTPAVRALVGLERRLPALADHIAFLRGQAEDLAGDPQEAARAFAEVPETSLLWPEARVALARAREEVEEEGAALEALAPVLGLSPPEEPTRTDSAAEALLLAARLESAHQADGDLLRARRHFIDCWALHPLSGLAEACLAGLHKLPRPAGPDPDPEDGVRRVTTLLDSNRNGPALREIVPLVARLPEPGPGEALACRAFFELGRAERRERQHTKAMEALRPVVDRCQDPALRVRALFVLASSAAVVKPEEAVGFYRMLAHDYPQSPLADDALYYAADLLARAGQTDEALATLGELAESYPEGDFRAEALFRSAWIERQAKRLDDAIGALRRIEHDYEASDPYEFARAVYWRGRFLAERGDEGDEASAREAFNELALKYPLDYYGLLARTRLEEAKPGSAPSWPRPVPVAAEEGLRYDAGLLASDPHFRAGVTLLRMGLSRLAADELGAVERRPSLGSEPVLLLAELLDRAGDHKTAHNLVHALARSVLRQKPEGLALRVWRVAYPPAFRDEVLRWAGPAGVEPDLLLALMREESGLDPNVISPAGAVGLTQLMPATARGVSKKLGLGNVHEADLMKPALAIRIGAAYLGNLLRRYRSEALALAAYNVGEAPVKGWLRDRGGLPLDAFVEEIPVQETRGYVKRVLRSYAAYRYLYGSEDARPVLVEQALPGDAEPKSQTP